jgi:hypothetical protein
MPFFFFYTPFNGKEEIRMTKENAINTYLGHPYKELYIVTNRIENMVAGTELWFLYPDLESAMRWINSVIDFRKESEPYFKELEREQEGEMIKKLVFEHHALGEMLTVTESFTTEKYSLGA